MTLNELFKHDIFKEGDDPSRLASVLTTETGHPFIAQCYNLTGTRIMALWNACKELDTVDLENGLIEEIREVLSYYTDVIESLPTTEIGDGGKAGRALLAKLRKEQGETDGCS